MKSWPESGPTSPESSCRFLEVHGCEAALQPHPAMEPLFAARGFGRRSARITSGRPRPRSFGPLASGPRTRRAPPLGRPLSYPLPCRKGRRKPAHPRRQGTRPSPCGQEVREGENFTWAGPAGHSGETSSDPPPRAQQGLRLRRRHPGRQSLGPPDPRAVPSDAGERAAGSWRLGPRCFRPRRAHRAPRGSAE